jgi:hypothetical protein
MDEVLMTNQVLERRFGHPSTTQLKFPLLTFLRMDYGSHEGSAHLGLLGME